MKKDGKVLEDTFLPRSIWSELMMTDSPYIRISIEEVSEIMFLLLLLEVSITPDLFFFQKKISAEV